MTKVSSSMNRFPVLEFHELANCWPLASKAEHDELVASIKQYGLKDKITLLDGKILDGRNRYNACKEAGVKPITEKLKDGEDPTAFVITKNTHRRHLTEAQKAMAAVKLKEYYEKQAEERRKQAIVTGNKTRHGSEAPVRDARPTLAHGRARDQAGAAVGVSGRTVERMETVVKEGAEPVIEAVMAGEVGIETASKLVKAVPDKVKQAEILKEGKSAVRDVIQKAEPKQESKRPDIVAIDDPRKPIEKDTLPEDKAWIEETTFAARVRGLLSSGDPDIVLREVLAVFDSLDERIAALRRVEPDLVKALEGEGAKEAVAVPPPPKVEDPHDAALNTFNQFDDHGKQIVYETTTELWTLHIGKKPKKIFKRPTLDEVRAYCTERKSSVDPEAFVDFYSANGWKLSNGNAMQDWQSAVRNWERKDKDRPKPSQPARKPDPAHKIYVPEEPAPTLGPRKDWKAMAEKLPPINPEDM